MPSADRRTPGSRTTNVEEALRAECIEAGHCNKGQISRRETVAAVTPMPALSRS